MRQQFDYLICQSQAGKVTFVNSEFAGQAIGDQSIEEVRNRMYDSCPNYVEFVTKAGTEGWELICGYVVNTGHSPIEKLIFKRPRN